MMTSTRQSIDTQFRRYYQKLSPILKKPKARASTAAVFSFLTISLFAFYAIRPTAKTIIYLRREISDKTKLNQQMENKITALIEAQSTYETITDSLSVIEQALPKNPDAVILARQLRNLAVMSGASISAMQIPNLPIIAQEATPGSKLTPQKPLETYPISLVISGSYISCKSFLEGILRMRRITNIDMLSIADADLLENTIKLSLRLQSYYSKQ